MQAKVGLKIEIGYRNWLEGRVIKCEYNRRGCGCHLSLVTPRERDCVTRECDIRMRDVGHVCRVLIESSVRSPVRSLHFNDVISLHEKLHAVSTAGSKPYRSLVFLTPLVRWIHPRTLFWQTAGVRNRTKERRGWGRFRRTMATTVAYIQIQTSLMVFPVVSPDVPGFEKLLLSLSGRRGQIYMDIFGQFSHDLSARNQERNFLALATHTISSTYPSIAKWQTEPTASMLAKVRNKLRESLSHRASGPQVRGETTQCEASLLMVIQRNEDGLERSKGFPGKYDLDGLLADR